MAKFAHKPAYVNAVGVGKASGRQPYLNTGTFGAHRAPRVVGVSDDVAWSTKVLAQRARRAERAWKRSLPKGVKV